MRITRWGEYGVLCSLYIARRTADQASRLTPVGAGEIAEQHGMPVQYAQQVLHRLRKGGIIKSTRGPKGGFLLCKSPEEISLRSVLQASEGHTFEVICESDPLFAQSSPIEDNINGKFAGFNEHDALKVIPQSINTISSICASSNDCSLRQVWNELRDKINSFLEAKTLASLMSEPSKSEPECYAQN